MSETVLFAFATRQMAPTIVAALAAARGNRENTRIVWLVDHTAEQEGWLRPCAKVLKAAGLGKLEKKTFTGGFTVSDADGLVKQFTQADRFIFCAQGGRKFDALVLQAALARAGKPLEIAYLDARPIRLNRLEIDTKGNMKQDQQSPASEREWPALTAAQIVQCSGYTPFSSEDESAGAGFERTVLKVVKEYVSSQTGLQDFIAGIERGIEIRKGEHVKKTDWDVSVTFKDATIIAFECKDYSSIPQLIKNSDAKDLQSRLLVLREAATTESRLWLVVHITDAHIQSVIKDKPFVQQWNSLKAHFAQVDMLKWCGYWDGALAEQWRVSNGLPSLEEQLAAILLPYAGMSSPSPIAAA